MTTVEPQPRKPEGDPLPSGKFSDGNDRRAIWSRLPPSPVLDVAVHEAAARFDVPAEDIAGEQVAGAHAEAVEPSTVGHSEADLNEPVEISLDVNGLDDPARGWRSSVPGRERPTLADNVRRPLFHGSGPSVALDEPGDPGRAS